MRNIILLFIFSFFSATSFAQQKENTYRLRDSIFAAGSMKIVYKEYEEAIALFKKAAELDTDTMFVAAKAYGMIATLYCWKLKDEVKQREASQTEWYYLNESIRKYPDDMDVYIYKLDYYSYRENPDIDPKDTIISFIKVCDSKFGHRWEMNYALATYYEVNHVTTLEEDLKTSHAYFRKTLELNPEEYNTMLQLYLRCHEKKAERRSYLKKMYAMHPEEFTLIEVEGYDSKDSPYEVGCIKSYYSPCNFSDTVDRKDCIWLGLKLKN